MSSNVHDFDLELKHFGDVEVPEACERFQRAVALEALGRVVKKTPVDTGRARANWQVTFGTPAAGEMELEDKRGGATIARGSGVIERLKGYVMAWITNNVPYAEELEKGSSQQAPAGMVAVTVAELKQLRKVTSEP